MSARIVVVATTIGTLSINSRKKDLHTEKRVDDDDDVELYCTDILRTEKTRVDRGSTTRATAVAAAASETIVNGARAAAAALALVREPNKR